MSETSTLKDKLLNEKTQLAEKIVKLKTFMEGERFNLIATSQQALLKIQYAAMCTYWECLNATYDNLVNISATMTEKDY